jgi:hypothetical protein
MIAVHKVTCKKYNNRDGYDNKNIYYKAATAASRATAEKKLYFNL